MRKFLTLVSILAITLPVLKASTPKPTKKVTITKIVDRLPRTSHAEEIECYFDATEMIIQSSFLTDMSLVTISVTNTNTGESWTDNFDSSETNPHVLSVSNEPGNYVVTYTTESSDIYEGSYDVYTVLRHITYLYDAAGNRTGRGI